MSTQPSSPKCIFLFHYFSKASIWHQDLHVSKNERAPNAILKIEYLIDEVLVNSFKFD